MRSTDRPTRMLQIGEVAERLGLSLRTIRYYEEMGLITPETRTGGGFRLYGNEEIERLRLIMEMKPLGFSVSEMGEMIAARTTLREDPGAADARDAFLRLAAQAERLRDKMRQRLAKADAFVAQLREEGRAFAPEEAGPAVEDAGSADGDDVSVADDAAAAGVAPPGRQPPTLAG
jgi:MerR family transcriptional regulator, copper efflux regulator